MKILAHVHLYPPVHNAGAEWMMHGILTYLRDVHGHDVQVITGRPPRRRDVFDGLPVEMVRDPRRQARFYQRADVVFTHLDVTRQAVTLAHRLRRPLVHVVHNDKQLEYHRVGPGDASLVVWNSKWIGDAHRRWPGPWLTVYPPVRCADYRPLPGPHDAVTLLNLTVAKGAPLFYELAERMPHRRFLGVRGAYGHQEPAPDLDNLEVIGTSKRVAVDVYPQARVVLMPSTYESWGRVAVEAAAAGVPTIAARTPGLVEAGVAFTYLRHDDVDRWARTVDLLFDDEEAWESARASASTRAGDLEAATTAQLEALARLLPGLEPLS